MTNLKYLGLTLSGIILLGAGCAREAPTPQLGVTPETSALVIEPAGEFPPAYARPIPENYSYFGMSVHYRGEAVVSGQYYVDGFLGEVCFKVAKESQQLIPKHGEGFCFSNQNDVIKKLYGVEPKDFSVAPDIMKSATVKIGNYQYSSTEAGGGGDSAFLIDVVSKSSQ